MVVFMRNNFYICQSQDRYCRLRYKKKCETERMTCLACFPALAAPGTTDCVVFLLYLEQCTIYITDVGDTLLYFSFHPYNKTIDYG